VGRRKSRPDINEAEEIVYDFGPLPEHEIKALLTRMVEFGMPVEVIDAVVDVAIEWRVLHGYPYEHLYQIATSVIVWRMNGKA